MGNRNRYKGAKAKREAGPFVPLSCAVLRSVAFTRLSPYAVKLLADLLAQYNGDNNGDLCAAWGLVQPRGWRSKATLEKARKELLAAGWLELTRQGGRNRCSLYSVTFFAIDECGGKLDVRPTLTPRSTWRLHEPLPAIKPVPRPLY